MYTLSNLWGLAHGLQVILLSVYISIRMCGVTESRTGLLTSANVILIYAHSNITIQFSVHSHSNVNHEHLQLEYQIFDCPNVSLNVYQMLAY